MASITEEPTRPVPAPVGLKRPLRYCGYCKSWNSKPCGEQCRWQPDFPTFEEVALSPDHRTEPAVNPSNPDRGEPVAWQSVMERLNAVAPAVEALACHQEQCDMDGVMVMVSRQAVDEVVNAINEIAIDLAARPHPPVSAEREALEKAREKVREIILGTDMRAGNGDSWANRKAVEAFEILDAALSSTDGRSSAGLCDIDITNHHNALKCPYCNPRGLKFADPHIPVECDNTPRLTDNDEGEITVALAGKELRGWSYASDDERRAKMLAAREYVEGFCDGRAA